MPIDIDCGSLTNTSFADKEYLEDSVADTVTTPQCVKVDKDTRSIDYYTDCTESTALCTPDGSVGNASFDSIELYEVEEDFEIFYHGPKVLSKNETPCTICTVNTIGTLRSRRLFRVLLDSGSSTTLIKKSALPRGCTLNPIDQERKVKTLGGNVLAMHMVNLRDIRLPEFDKNTSIEKQGALVFDNDSIKYDIIFGTNFLTKTGIKLDYSNSTMTWFDNILDMRPKGLSSQDFDAMEDAIHIQAEEDLFGVDWLDSYATEILDAKYEYTDVKDVVDRLNHLSASQKNDLLAVLRRHESMFDGSLGVYPHKKFHIDIEPATQATF